MDAVDEAIAEVVKVLMKLETLYDEADPHDPDVKSAAALYEVAAPQLIASAASPLPRERQSALHFLCSTAGAAPRKRALALLVKDKLTWAGPAGATNTILAVSSTAAFETRIY